DVDRLGDRGRQRLDVHLAGDVLEDAALDDAGGLLLADEVHRHGRLDGDLEVDAQQVDVHEVAAHRVALGLLQHGGRGRAAVDGELEHRAAGGERVAQRALVDGEGDGALRAAVEHAGNLA